MIRGRVAALRLAAITACCALALGASAAAHAHALAPSLLSLDERPGGEVEVLWRTPLQTQSAAALRPRFPADCVPTGATARATDGVRLSERFRLRCAAPTLVGVRLGVLGLDESGTTVLVRVGLADGRRLASLLSTREPDYVVPPGAAIAAAIQRFVAMGAGHLASGWDHLLFLAGLVCLVRGGRRLLGAVTAFTAGHSVTLGLAVLGVVRLPGALVEIGIAASLVVLAGEVARTAAGRPPGALSQRPWALAFGFGLLHGLGFAGALTEAGLPPSEVPMALFGFNLGIEAAQLGFVAILLAGARAAGSLPQRWQALVPRLAAEAIGVVGVFLCCQRAAAAFGL